MGRDHFGADFPSRNDACDDLERAHACPLRATRRSAQGWPRGACWESQPADATQLLPNAAGATATASFHATDFAAHWLSKTDVTVTAELRSADLDLTVTAKNVGEEAEPMGIGWQPRFVDPGR